MKQGHSGLADKDWVPITPADSETLPAHGCVMVTSVKTIHGRVVYVCGSFGVNHPGEAILLINGPMDVTYGNIGHATSAYGHPIAGLVDSTTATRGDIIGAPHETFAMQVGGASGGFVVLGDGPVASTQMVLRNSQTPRNIVQIGWDDPIHSNPGAGYNIWEFATNDYLTFKTKLSNCRGNLTGAGVELLTATSANDPCLRLTKPGLYKFVIWWRLTEAVSSPGWTDYSDEITVEQTGTTDAHTHDYDKWTGTPLVMLGTISFNNEVGSWAHGFGEITREVYRWRGLSKNGQSDVVIADMPNISSSLPLDLSIAASAAYYSGPDSSDVPVLQLDPLPFSNPAGILLHIEYIPLVLAAST